MSVEDSFWQSRIFVPPPLEEGKYGLLATETDLPVVYDSIEELSKDIERLNPNIRFVSKYGDGIFHVYGTSKLELDFIRKSNQRETKKALKWPLVTTICSILFFTFISKWDFTNELFFVIMAAIYVVNPLISALLDFWSDSKEIKRPIEESFENARFSLWLGQSDFNLIWVFPAMLATCFVIQLVLGMDTVVSLFGLVKPLSSITDSYR